MCTILPVKNRLYNSNMIQSLFNFLFDFQFNGVQNLDIFIDHFESQKSCASTILKCKFCKILYYCALNLCDECTV